MHQTSMQLETVGSPEDQTTSLTFIDRLSECAAGGGGGGGKVPSFFPMRRLLVPQSMAVEEKLAIAFDAGVGLKA